MLNVVHYQPMPGKQDSFPHYPWPLWLMVKMIASLITGRARSFKKDAQEALRGFVPLHTCGELPDLGRFESGCLVTINHYHRPGFHSWWIALSLADVFPADLHWTMTSAYTYPDRVRSLLITPLTTILLRRLASIYRFTSMPPMPPHPADQTDRAIAVRRLIRYARASRRPFIAFAPEGMDAPDGQLSAPPAGVGRLVGCLSGLGMGIQPVGEAWAAWR